MIDSSEIPMGFMMQLAANEKAMTQFSNAPEERRKQIIEGARNIQSYHEMQKYVSDLGKENKIY